VSEDAPASVARGCRALAEGLLQGGASRPWELVSRVFSWPRRIEDRVTVRYGVCGRHGGRRGGGRAGGALVRGLWTRAHLRGHAGRIRHQHASAPVVAREISRLRWRMPPLSSADLFCIRTVRQIAAIPEIHTFDARLRYAALSYCCFKRRRHLRHAPSPSM
jgi:hypothetical protein